MKTGNVHKGSAERRDAIRALIKMLEAELYEIEARIAESTDQKGVRLTKEFFWKSVFPLLAENGEKGLTVSKLSEKLDQLGFKIDRAKLRSFLTRSRKAGLLDYVGRTKGTGFWKLSENAYSNSKAVFVQK